MKILLCWSGDQSHELAKALNWWLPLVHVAFEPRLAPTITPGMQWEETWQHAIAESQLGVVCVTPDSLRSPWLMFEAGAVTSAWGTNRILGYLHCILANDVTDTPMGVLRCKTATYDGTLQLVLSLNSVLPEQQRLTEAGLYVLVKPLWSRLERALTQFGLVSVAVPSREPGGASLQLAASAAVDAPRSKSGSTKSDAPSRRYEHATPLSEPPEWSAVLEDGCIDHVTLDDLTAMIDQGRIGPDTPLRKEGMTDYCAAQRFGELSSLFLGARSDGPTPQPPAWT